MCKSTGKLIFFPPLRGATGKSEIATATFRNLRRKSARDPSGTNQENLLLHGPVLYYNNVYISQYKLRWKFYKKF